MKPLLQARVVSLKAVDVLDLIQQTKHFSSAVAPIAFSTHVIGERIFPRQYPCLSKSTKCCPEEHGIYSTTIRIADQVLIEQCTWNKRSRLDRPNWNDKLCIAAAAAATFTISPTMIKYIIIDYKKSAKPVQHS